MPTSQTDTSATRTPGHYEVPTFATIIFNSTKPGEIGVRRSEPVEIAKKMVAEGKACYA